MTQILTTSSKHKCSMLIDVLIISRSIPTVANKLSSKLGGTQIFRSYLI